MSPAARDVARDLRTARHIPLRQLAARARIMAARRAAAANPAKPIQRADAATHDDVPVPALPRLPTAVLAPEGLELVRERAVAFAAGRFCYLGVEADFSTELDWSGGGRSPLWTYQLQYLGSVFDLALSGDGEAARRITESWIAACGERWDAVAWHPYPVSLRITNLCHGAAVLGGFEQLGDRAAAATLRQVAYLIEHLEHDVRGNHLLENARALLTAAHFFEGPLASRASAAARTILDAEIPEQTAEGAHFELSPMYHVIVLQRLVEMHALLGADEPFAKEVIAPAIHRMTAHLDRIACPDGDIPLFGDSAREFAPSAARMSAVAREACGDSATTGCAQDSGGLHVFESERTWAVCDAGPICPVYLPAHGQSDTLSLEIWVDGARVVTDPGLHEYTGPERAWGRSSRAHSTITIDDADHSEVYGSFRVGGRERLLEVERTDASLHAAVRPWDTGESLARRVSLVGDTLLVEDEARCGRHATARSRLHLDPEVTLSADSDLDAGTARLRTPAGTVVVSAGGAITIEKGRCSQRFGEIRPTTILVLVHGRDADGVQRARMQITPADGPA